MGETHWERKQRHLNEDHKARRGQTKRTIGLIKSEERIDRLTADIEAARPPQEERPVSTELVRLGAEWAEKRSSILVLIWSSPYLTTEKRSAWSRVVQEAAVTDRDDASLTGLRASVFLESCRFDGRVGRFESLSKLASEVSALIELQAQARAHG